MAPMPLRRGSNDLLALVGLEEKRRSRINTLSGGQQQRLAIALALVNTPRIAFLDEPTTGLDPAARRTLWQTIRDIRAAGTTVVLTTHYMEEAEQLCDRIAIMDRGRVVACDTPRALIQQLGADATVRATVQDGSIARDDLHGLEGVVAAELRDRDGSAVLRAAHDRRPGDLDRPPAPCPAPARDLVRSQHVASVAGRRLPGPHRAPVRG